MRAAVGGWGGRSLFRQRLAVPRRAPQSLDEVPQTRGGVMKNYAVLGALTAVLVAPAAMAQQAQARGGTAVVVAPAPALPFTSYSFRHMAIVCVEF